MTRVGVTVTKEGDATEQSRRVSDFLFNRCPGNVAELAVIDFLRKHALQADRYPWVKGGSMPEINRASDAVMHCRADSTEER